MVPGHKYVRSPIRGQPSTPTHSRQTVRSADITTGPRKSAELCSAAKRVRQRVVAGELDAVVVGGGDGRIRTVASVLAGSDVPLGIIPLGTLNHFARDLRIPVFADRAIAVIASGEKRYVDVGEINGKIFINNSSIGIYPYLFLNESGGGAESGFPNGQQLFWPYPRPSEFASVSAQDSHSRTG